MISSHSVEAIQNYTLAQLSTFYVDKVAQDTRRGYQNLFDISIGTKLNDEGIQLIREWLQNLAE